MFEVNGEKFGYVYLDGKIDYYTKTYSVSDLSVNEQGDIATEDVESAKENRVAYLQQMNEMLFEVDNDRESVVYMIQRQVETNMNSWDWT